MAHTGTLRLFLEDVTKQPIGDPSTLVSIRRVSGNLEIRRFRTSFPPARDLELPAFPLENALVAWLEPGRFRDRFTDIFVLSQGQVTTRSPRVFRDPARWTPEFTKWGYLGPGFAELKSVLGQSGAVAVKDGPTLPSMTGEAFDDLSSAGKHVTAAKMACLNLYAKLTQLKEPVHKRKPWFRFIRKIRVIDRERLVAEVDPEMAERVSKIREDAGAFGYSSSSSALHFRNFPAEYRVPRSRMMSIKSDERNGNVQLTLAPGTHPDSGGEVWLLDADIDENGEMFRHLLDVFKHRFTGGTHPVDIHEYLVMSDPLLDLGYALR